MSDRSHLSIGEVLSLLHDEFPDVTISKIRFLESQGLIDPERTPSGYRKFYDADVARLRWILRQQREHFLPLKVIRDRLDGGEDVLAAMPPGDDAATGDAAASDGDATDPAPADAPPAGPPLRPSVLAGPTPTRLARDELVQRSGCTVRELAELERYGLVVPIEGGQGATYDEDALVVAQAAAALRARGVEARHLRMYKVAAEREAGFIEQLVAPQLRQRGARRQEGVAALDDLLALGDAVRGALLRQAFRPHLPGR